MRVARTVGELRAALAPARRQRRTIGFVPTMGALHAGHLSLVSRARAETEFVVVSIFVNPLQFGPGEDFDAYPRDLDADLGMLQTAGVGLVFAPEREQFTPHRRRTTVHVDGLTARLEGASRPTHFDGVTTIVTKLLNAVRPDRAYFGEKDFQQLAVIRTMVADLDLEVRIVGCPIVRDPDGLALSSRNAYLTAEQRRDALAIPAALRALAASFDGDADGARRWLRSTLSEAPGLRLDYAEVVDPETLEPLEGVMADPHRPARALVAAQVGPAGRQTRLIDNVRLERPRGA